jgi:starch phosphorylase
MSAYCDNLNISKDQCMDLAQSPIHRDPHAFNMTILAFHLSEHANAVSKLHGDVSRRMWHHLWPDRDQDNIPIDIITNGVHVRTWMTYAMKNLLDRYLEPDWRYQFLDRDFWEKVKDIPDEELWQTHLKLKQTLIEEIRCRLEQQLERNGETQEMIEEARNILDPNILTIGFARRFAPYKRATLLFRNRDHLKQILWNSDHPVQIVFAGKAHPANQPGKALIQEIYNESRSPDFIGRVVFIENYDIYLARRMVSGVDVWLNTPRRPLEASGTSGMKVVANGGLNLSILDGWWSEGFDGKNGWAISENKTMYDEFEQDEADSQSLYHLLENEIVPLYYTKDKNNIPSGWTQKMKTSMASIIPRFNTDRMLKEYMEKMYSKSLV